MTRPRYSSVVEIPASGAMLESEENQLELWKRSHRAAELYEYLRSHPGDMKLSNLGPALSMSHRTVYRAIGWLEDRGFLQERYQKMNRVITLNPVPTFADETKVQTIGRYSIPMEAPNGVKCHEEPLSNEELLWLLENTKDISSKKFDHVLAVYDFLRTCAKPFFLYELAEYTAGDNGQAHEVMRVLEKAHLIIQADSAVAVFPVQPKETIEMFADELNVTVLSPVLTEITNTIKARSANSDFTKLLNLYEALVRDRGLEQNTTARDKIAIVNMLKQASYASIRPALAMFIMRPEYFQRISDRIERYGVSMSTFQINYAGITAALDDIKRQYPVNRDGWWHQLLSGDLEHFRYD
jgi:hypothetical protein